MDTELADRHGILAGQVTGGCFCCRFSELVEAAERLREFDPDVIFAEAVGSCTDIAATTVRPLLRDHGQSFQVAPFTVVVDPRARYDDPELRFLFEQQIAEADLVVESKSDLGPGAEGRRSLSARTGEGVAEWLDEVLGGGLTAGGSSDRSGLRTICACRGVAGVAELPGGRGVPTPLSPAMLVGPLLDRLDAALSAAGVQMVHLKLLDEAVSGYIKAAICANGQEPSVEGMLDASPARSHEILLNIRAARRSGSPADDRGAGVLRAAGASGMARDAIVPAGAAAAAAS